jgi:hypothetical protein
MNTRIRRINIEKLDFSTIISDEQSEINDADNTQINGILHNYPFYPPTIFINDIRFIIPHNKWKAQFKSFDVLINIIHTLEEQSIIIPDIYGFETSGLERSFNSDDLHHQGYLYDCHNFTSKKYQFGSGFIYSIIHQFSQKYNLDFSIETINNFVDRLLECSLIKELGCLYLVLKIYEEFLINTIDKYISQINQYLKSTEIKEQLKQKIVEFKKENSFIVAGLDDKITNLNYILTIYVNIWLYSIFTGVGISYDLNGIIEKYIQTQSHSETETALYSWVKSFIIKGDKSIDDFNSELFQTNYDYVTQIFRKKSPSLIKIIVDFLIIVKSFNNFSNDMIITKDTDGADLPKILIYQLSYRTLLFKSETKSDTNTFPESIVRIETTERDMCSAFLQLLEMPISTIIPGSICDNYE